MNENLPTKEEAWASFWAALVPALARMHDEGRLAPHADPWLNPGMPPAEVVELMWTGTVKAREPRA